VPSAITCESLTRSFDTVAAVRGVTFAVEGGELFGLLGPNGAGKSTTVHMLTTVLEPSGGSATVLGYDVTRDAASVRSLMGMVFQEPALDERLTARENLAMHAVLYAIPRHAARESVQRALAWASLDGDGDRPVRTFSGGMKRRLELARALMHEPKVLFLDEPTVGLDPQARRHLWESIRALRGQGLTVFMTTHYLEEAEDCDRVAIMDHGEIIAQGSPDDLKSRLEGPAERSLEDVFLDLTGRELRDEGATPRARLLAFGKRGGEHTR
jgi:ABC-2 type transport system ATP-binding protein